MRSPAWTAVAIGSLAMACQYDVHVGATGADAGPRPDVGTLTGTPSTAEWVELVGWDRQELGDALAFADLDDDGLDDAILADRRNSDAFGMPYRGGSVFIVYGRRERLSGSVSLMTADARVIGPPHETGGVLPVRGDYDGDGIDDVAISFAGTSMSRGSIHILYGSTRRISGSPFIEDIAPILEGPDSFANFFGSPGDLDADGCDELITTGLRSELLILRGRRDRWIGTSTAEPAMRITAGAGAEVMVVLGRAGDLDGDGAIDLLAADWTAGFRVGVFYGPVAISGTRSLDTADARIAGMGQQWSGSRGDFDLDADGRSELIVPSDTGVGGAVHLFMGGRGRLAGDVRVEDADVTLFGESPSGLGLCTSAGDVDGDGRDDLLIGAPSFGSIDPLARLGRMYRVFGMTAAGSLASADMMWEGRLFPPRPFSTEPLEEMLGSAVAQDGDFDGDGYADALLGSYAGITRLVYGAPRD